MAAEWLCELGFQQKTYTDVVSAVTKHKEEKDSRENETEEVTACQS
jgi:hypothetical protein